MTKQTINVGSTANDGTGSTIRAGGQIANSNFTEIYNAIGDGTTIQFDIAGATSGQTLVYNAGTNKFEPGTGGAFTVAGDSGSDQLIAPGNIFRVQGGTGIATAGVNTDIVSVAIDSTVATLIGSQTLTNKNLTSATNTFPSTVATLIGSQTLTNKNLTSATNTFPTISFLDDSSTVKQISLGGTFQISGGSGITAVLTGSNTLEISTDGSIVTETSTDTLTNKSIDSDNNTITNIVNADIKSSAAIDASKIHDGSISNTEFSYLNGVTSNIQDQINAAGLAFAIALGGE